MENIIGLMTDITQSGGVDKYLVITPLVLGILAAIYSKKIRYLFLGIILSVLIPIFLVARFYLLVGVPY